MNTEEKFAPKGMLKMDLQVNPEGKTAIDVLVDGDFKSLVYLVSTLFKEEPRMYDLMKEAVEFHEFRNNMNDMNSILDAIKNGGTGGLGEMLKKIFDEKCFNNGKI
ncbi:hypothetical protein [Empedobacter sp.]|uniref:hypothetical protein n=1 Tax=Empedobacter sp. TaxID=1927715 RepID=UPI0028AF4B3D|nr:hypothetical protein [Empedobacter sp.]